MSMNIDGFRAALSGGGARPNLFQVTGTFPNVATNAIGQVTGAISAVAGSVVGPIAAGISNALGGGGPSGKIKFLCKAASLPPSTVGTIEVPFRGRKLKIPGDRTFAEWQLTVINDTDFALRDAFERWSQAINGNVTNVGGGDLYGQMQEWRVDQLARTGPSLDPNPLKTYQMVGCWPSEVGQIELSSETTDAIEEFTVTMQYQYWISNTSS